MRELFLHRTFYIYVLAGVSALILAFVFPVFYPWAVCLLCIWGILMVVDGILLFGLGRRIQAFRKMSKKFSNGDDNPVEVQVVNHYPFRMKIRLIDEIPVLFQRRDLEMRFSLFPGEAYPATYFLHPVKRGEYEFGKIHVFVSSFFSLLERRYSFEDKQTIMVYPSFVAMRKYELMAFAGRQAGSNSRRIRVAGISTAFEQIKPYIQGDDPRTVNWKATAKCNRLMVNSYTEERARMVYSIVDEGRAMLSPFNGMSLLDYAINAVLSLSNVVLKKGDFAGLITFSDKMGTIIKADNRRTQLNNISEALYNQITHYLEPDFEQLCVTINRHIPTRSLLMLFTNFDTVNGMRRYLPVLKRLARTHLLLVILFENTEVNRELTLPATSMRDIYYKTIAGSFLLEKKQITRELRKAGIYTILTQPEDLTVNVINGYLDLKERGLV